MSAKEISCHIACQEKWLGGTSGEHSEAKKQMCMKKTLSVVKSPSNHVRVSWHIAIKMKYRPSCSFTVHYSVNLHTETSFKIRPFESRELKENMRRWCWLLIREWLGKAGFTTAKLNTIQHMLLYHFFYVSFLLSRTHTWPQMLTLCVRRRGKVKDNDVILPTCSDTSTFFICFCLQSHKRMYPIAHTQFHSSPETMRL